MILIQKNSTLFFVNWIKSIKYEKIHLCLSVYKHLWMGLYSDIF